MQRLSKRARLWLLAGVAAAMLAAAGPAWSSVGPLVLVSGPSPFAPGCEAAPQSGTVYPNAEVEPWVDVNPTNQDNVIGNWQQDRWSNGGARGQLAAFSMNGGQSWTIPPISTAANTGQAKFSRCTGGSAANGGNFERATDPWVSFSPNGVAHQASLAINDSNVAHAVLAARSTDRGMNWQNPVTIKFDNRATVFNDKETLTADWTDSRFVYATWQRIVFPTERASATAAENTVTFKSVAWFARSSDNGLSYTLVKPVFDPGQFNQTIGNEIVVLPNGDLVMLFNWIRNVRKRSERGFTAAVMRSTNKGATWSAPITINRMITDGVRDPRDGHDVRTGDLLPQMAVDRRSGALYVVWQDDRFTGQEQIAFSKSTNGGRSWTPARRISKTPNGKQAFTPVPQVADDGTVAVLHYDFRNDSAATPPLTTDTWLLRSTNGGTSWTEERVGPAYDMRTAPDARGFFVGDYEALGFARNGSRPGFKPFFVRANNGNLANRTDVFATTASRHGP